MLGQHIVVVELSLALSYGRTDLSQKGFFRLVIVFSDHVSFELSHEEPWSVDFFL